MTYPAKVKKQNSAMPLYIYWLVLVIWQNIGGYNPTSFFAIVIKVGLMGYLTLMFLKNGIRGKNKNFLLWGIFAVYTIILFYIRESGFSMSAAIYYFFPVLLSFLTLVCHADDQLNQKQFLLFLKLVIAAVSYMAFYGIIFETSRFTGFLSLRAAYGNEFASFLISNHEYGMYLVFAITSTIICYQNTERFSAKVLYLFLLLLFAVNLLATLSRTSMLACGVIVAIFALISKNSSIKNWFLLVMAMVVCVVIFVPQAGDFIETVLMKENNDAGRFDMWNAALNKFKFGNLSQKWFGYGYTYIDSYVEKTFEHGSVHNMFLQMLLVWGIFGMTYLVGAILGSIKAALSIFKYNRNMSVIFLALALSIIAFMFTNTTCVMQSPIDSFMLTMFTVVVPKYTINAIKAGNFDKV